MSKILVVEDEPGIALGLEDTLRLEGYDVEVVTDGARASRLAQAEPFDLILLDAMLPGKSGFEVCREVRRSGVQCPIIFLTARSEEGDRIGGLNLGANDYVTKPFSPKELMARIRSMLRFVERSRENEKRLEAEMMAASTVQQRLFPAAHPAVPGIEYAGACRAARGVSGDYYDFLQLPSGRLALLLADVSGKGMAAALLAASIHAAVRAYAPAAERACGDVLARINRLLYETTGAERFATVFYAVYDPGDGTLTWANAGHCPPMCVRAGGEIVRLDSLTAPAGIMAEIDPVERTFALSAGDGLLIFSDGIVEARDPGGEEFGEARLAQLIPATTLLGPQARCSALLDAVREFTQGYPQADDQTVVTAFVTSPYTPFPRQPSIFYR